MRVSILVSLGLFFLGCSPAFGFWQHRPPRAIFHQHIVFFPGVSVGEIRGRVISHGLDCRPTVVVDSSHDVMLPWVSGVTEETFQVRVKNLGVPPADVDVTATFWCID